MMTGISGRQNILLRSVSEYYACTQQKASNHGQLIKLSCNVAPFWEEHDTRAP